MSANINMKKLILIISLCILLIIAGCSSGKSAKGAILSIDEGTVQVFSDGNWANAQNGMELKSSDKIKTLENSEASVIFFDSSVIRLDENTEVSLDSLLSDEDRSTAITQESGRTWSRVTKASGLSSYSVKTPNTVATVRGTAFYISLEGEEELYGVDEGEVSLSNLENIESVKAGDEVALNKKLKKAAVRKAIKNEWHEKNAMRDKDFVISTREKVKIKHNTKIALLKKAKGLSDEQVNEYLDGYLTGKYKDNQAQIDEYLKKYNVEPTL